MDIQLLQFEKSDIFTPDNISKVMSNYLLNEGNLLEPSVGTGQLLKFINIEKYESIDIYDIKNEYLDKCINSNNIIKYNKDFIEANIEKKYKNIIMNPPFIRIQNLSKDYRNIIKNKWSFLKGNIDIYYAFILKCIDLLEDDGILVSITPNSYLYNKSGIEMRKYLIENKYIREIIDYKSEKVFKNVSTYCCITIFDKKEKEYIIYNNEKIYYNLINKSPYQLFVNNENINNEIENKKLENICSIKNGIATLRDNIYIHKDKKFNEPCWKEITNSRNIFWIIYPYNEDGKIIEENIFKKDNPLTYDYLMLNKEELNKRDNGNKKYITWYAYGRSQSIIKPKSDKVIYLPTFIDPNNFHLSISNSYLFYSCLCIELVDNNYTYEFIIDKIIQNKEYIINNSSKRGSGWINLSSSLLKNIIL